MWLLHLNVECDYLDDWREADQAKLCSFGETIRLIYSSTDFDICIKLRAMNAKRNQINIDNNWRKLFNMDEQR